MPLRLSRLFTLLLLALLALPVHGQETEPPAQPERQRPDFRIGPAKLKIDVSIAESALDEPYSGRIYLIFGQPVGASGEPRQRMSYWTGGPEVFAKDVQNLAPGETVSFTGEEMGFPIKTLAELQSGLYSVQAVARVNPDSPSPGDGRGNLHSAAQLVQADPEILTTVPLTIDREARGEPFIVGGRVRLFEMRSEKLSAFHGRDITMRAGVVVPTDFEKFPDRKWPVIYEIGGFGGTHHTAMRHAQDGGMGSFIEDAIIVVPDPSWYYGHTGFADSAVNGPWGTALVEELIPAIEDRYRGAGPDHRYIWGVSSGGWSTIWLVINHPETFRAGFAHVPDPVDFRDFQQIDLYKPGVNMYTDEQGERRPVARHEGEPVLWYDDFVSRETVLGPGGQIGAFEAAFSPRLPDGSPRPLFNRETGEVDPQTADAWKRYDIRRFLEANWNTLAPKISGRLNIWAGGEDTFYLEGAVQLLKQFLESRNANMVVEVIPGMAHQPYFPGLRAMVELIQANWANEKADKPEAGAAAAPDPVTFFSVTFASGEQMPKDYTVDGKDISPPFSWTDLPEGTQELALICDDPGVRPPNGWVHWVIYGIPAQFDGLPESLPQMPMLPDLGGAAQGKTSWGNIGWRGPAGRRDATHNYVFRLYALDEKLNLQPGLTKQELLDAMKGHIIGQAEYIGANTR